jgi:hypothetical protein
MRLRGHLSARPAITGRPPRTPNRGNTRRRRIGEEVFFAGSHPDPGSLLGAERVVLNLYFSNSCVSALGSA